MRHTRTLFSDTPDVSGMQPSTGKLSVVTGGAGFIGRHLVQMLLDRGHRVRVIDLQAPKHLDERVDYVHGTILDDALLRSVIEGADQVFHLAANPNLWAVDKQEFYELNFLGTRAVLEAAGRAGVKRIIHTSTESILKGHQKDKGNPVNETVVRMVEDMPGLYCRSKFLAEQEAMSAARYGLPVIIVNPTLPIGPGDYLITPPTQMLLDYVNGSNPGYLEFDMNLIDVRDVALGHILAAERGRIGERYILGGENLRMFQVLTMLQELTDVPMPRLQVPYPVALGVAAISEFIADTVTHRPPKASLAGVRVAGASMIFDCAKAMQELGHSPRPVRQAIAEGLLFLCQQGRVKQPGLEARLHAWQFANGRER